MNTNAVSACESCPAHNAAGLKRMGVDISSSDYVIALAGNPNVGKSTVFNALTGLRQHTGNWPGKTVGRAEGGFSYADKRYKIVDLPGAYSLLSTSVDEEIARDFILFASPDVTVVVIEAIRLERNLNLVLQVLDITDRVVVCVNLMDEAKRHGFDIDERAMMKELGVPVVKATARSKQGIPELLERIRQVATGEFKCSPRRHRKEPPHVKQALDELSALIAETYPDLPNARWVAMRLLEGDQKIIDGLRDGELTGVQTTTIKEEQDKAIQAMQESAS